MTTLTRAVQHPNFEEPAHIKESSGCKVTLNSSEPSRVSKKAGYGFYQSVLHSPRYIVAPMVDGSELAWRILSRYYGAELCYTPMIHAALFAQPRNVKYRQEQFDIESGEEGARDLDRPLIAQFCANDPDTLLSASNLIASSGGEERLDLVDGFDLNLGCPQGIAKKGKYGAFLMDHLDLIQKISE